MKLTIKIHEATRFAIKTHEVYQKQKRKGKDISYITHPLKVGLLLARAGASEDVVAAGILHDTIEDSIPEKKVTKEMLKERFGKNVSEMVMSVTEENKNLPWEERKRKALENIGKFSHDSLLVKSADVISNISEILDDYAKYGDEIFSRFNAPKEKFVSHNLQVVKALIKKWDNNPFRKDLDFLAKHLGKI